MKNARIMLFAASVFLFHKGAETAERLFLRVYFYHVQSLGSEGRQQLNGFLSPSSRPEMAALGEMAGRSDAEFRAGIISSLMEVFDLDSVEDLFLLEKEWDGRSKVPMKGRVANSNQGFLITINPKSQPSGRILLKLGIAKTKKDMRTALNPWEDLENIFDREVEVALEEPVIVGVPYGEGGYFAAILATKQKFRESRQVPTPESKIEMVPAPSVIRSVPPSYPGELRRRGIGGEVGMQVAINEKGEVVRVDVTDPIHPYLNYAAVQALRQWAFEPVVRKGKPVPAAFRCGWNFDPITSASEPIPREIPELYSPPLSRLLERSGEYCEKLSSAVFDFVCDETIQEVRYGLLKNVNWIVLTTGPKPKQTGAGSYYDISERTKPSEQMEFSDASQSRYGDLVQDRGQVRPKVERLQIMDPTQTRRDSFLCDYMFVRKRLGQAVERRVVLKENGRTVGDRDKVLDDKRFSGLSALLSPLRILARDQQGKYDFAVVGEDKVQKKKAVVVRAVPKSGDEDGIWSVRIWLNKETGQVLKCDIEGVPLEGYDDVLEDSVNLNIRPSFIVTHEYRLEKNGVLFPYRSSVKVEYPGVDPLGSIPKILSRFTYEKYRFFIVETEYRSSK